MTRLAGNLASMTEFDDALALDRVDDGIWRGRLSDQWSIGGAVNGGLLMALAGRALGEHLGEHGGNASGHDAPVAFSAYFLSASGDGPAELRTEVVRVGRTMSTGQVSLFQDKGGVPVERLRALASYGDLATWAHPVLREPEPPRMPPPDQCVSASMAPGDFVASVPLLGRFDLRLDPATAGWALGQPSEQGVMRGWIRFADGRPVDALSLLFFLDALPPVSFDLGIMGWAPTLEFTGHIRAEPTDGWLRVELTTRTVTGGLLEEDAMVWDSTGRMVAQSRQLAGIRLPAGAGAGGAGPSGAAG
jgi:acyl-CoA thioesterase